jgi:hypothetical protein
MSKSLIQLKLFVSITKELEHLRKLIGEVIDDANRYLESSCNVTIRVIDWRIDIVPGVNIDPQQVINAQTGDYDIYLGILGTRFGTSTKRAGSGLEEEFNIAYKRYHRDQTSIRLLFYFYNAFDGNIMNVDLDQLKRVQEFRKLLGSEKGVLFNDFNSPEEFMKYFRNHIIQLVSQQWDGSAWKPVPGLEANFSTEVDTILEPDSSEEEPDDEEPGILDLRVKLDESFELAMSSIRQIIDLMSEGSKVDIQWQVEAQKATTGKFKPKKAQELVNSKADDFGKRARKLRSLTLSFNEASDDFFDLLGQMIQFQLSSGISTTEEMKNGVLKISNIGSVVKKASESYNGVISSLSSLPEPTRNFKIQKRNLISQIEKLRAALGSWLDRSSALHSRFVSENDSAHDNK